MSYSERCLKPTNPPNLTAALLRMALHEFKEKILALINDDPLTARLHSFESYKLNTEAYAILVDLQEGKSK